jgi:hypothetical protein
MRTRTVVIPSVMLAIAVSLCAGPLAAQPVQASRSHETTHEVYAPSVTPAIYLINFLLLYMANPDLGAYMPAYKAAIPQAVVDCLEQNPTGCPYADTTGISIIPEVAVIETGNAFGRTFARRMRDGRSWPHANSDNRKISTSHWGGGGPTSSLTSLAWTQV